MPDTPPLTPEQIRVLSDFANNYLYGRPLLCLLFKTCVTVGILAGGLAAFGDHIMAICAKDYQLSIGNFRSVACRAREAGNYYSAHFQSNMQQMMHLGEVLKKQLSIV